MEPRKSGIGWGWKALSAIISTSLIVAGAYAWSGLTATAGDTLFASKWNELVDRTEPVMAQYNMGTIQSCANGPTGCIVNFDTKEYDSHNAVTTGSNWKFTVPVSGTYRVTSVVWTAAYNWWNATNSIWTGLLKNGVWVKSLGWQYVVTTSSVIARVDGSATVKASIGDTLAIQFIPWRSSAGVDLQAVSYNTWISIERIGP